MQNKPLSAIDASENTLLELSAREVQVLIQRFGVRSEGCPEVLETMDMLLALEQDLQSVLPPPVLVPVQPAPLH